MRYLNQRIFTNAEAAYRRYLKKRGLDLINQYNTPRFKFPTAKEASNFSTINYVWGAGDRYFKLANEYYNDPELWWVIAFYNQKPTEFQISPGDTIFIPVPLETVLFYIGY
tara:strand:- start:516 stop:848 length:333 start_codon:yes stop_codon:yes gene_type:complete